MSANCKNVYLRIGRRKKTGISLRKETTHKSFIRLGASDRYGSAPQPPQNLSVVTVGAGQVDLDWDDLATSFDTYTLYVKNTSTGSIEQTITGLSVSSHTPAGLTSSVQYEFWVTSVRDGIESAESNHVFATPS